MTNSLDRVQTVGRQDPAGGERTRERILVEASELFARRGFHGTSTRAIADAVGIRQPSLFHHFATKSAVMKALLAENVDPMRAVSGELVTQGGSPAVRLARFGLRAVELALRSPFEVAGLFHDDVLNSTEFDGHRRNAEQLRGDQRRLIAQGIAAGELLDVDPRTAQLLFEAVVLAGVRRHRGEEPGEAAAHARQIVTLALRMLLVDQSSIAAVLRSADG